VLRTDSAVGADLLEPLTYPRSRDEVTTGIKPRRTTLKMKSRDEDLAKALSADAGKGPVQSGRWP
jgi:hypothetical protein